MPCGTPGAGMLRSGRARRRPRPAAGGRLRRVRAARDGRGASGAARARTGPAGVADPGAAGLAPPWTAADYDGAVRAALLAHKERHVAGLAATLGALLAVAVAAAARPPVLLVPVPSRPGVVRARGHDPLLAVGPCVRREDCPARPWRRCCVPAAGSATRRGSRRPSGPPTSRVVVVPHRAAAALGGGDRRAWWSATTCSRPARPPGGAACADGLGAGGRGDGDRGGDPSPVARRAAPANSRDHAFRRDRPVD